MQDGSSKVASQKEPHEGQDPEYWELEGAILKIRNFAIAPVAAVMMMVGTTAHAVPQLQLNIVGGTYNTAHQTIMASSNSFSLYAYYQGSAAPTGNFYISMALQPSTSLGGSYGSFSMMSGTTTRTISATSGMVYGNPPIESLATLQPYDPGDLSPHGIFPTWFAEQAFTFLSTNTSGVYNTQDNPGSGPMAGTGMYFAKFDFNISGLALGTGLHFDLYNEQLQVCGKNKNCVPGDIDVYKFAPFSHDAGAMVFAPPPVTSIPEPETYALLLAGLGLLGFAARRRKLKEAAAA